VCVCVCVGEWEGGSSVLLKCACSVTWGVNANQGVVADHCVCMGSTLLFNIPCMEASLGFSCSEAKVLYCS
jgi:hypothetical protein